MGYSSSDSESDRDSRRQKKSRHLRFVLGNTPVMEHCLFYQRPSETVNLQDAGSVLFSVTLITKSEIPSTKSVPYCKVPVKDLSCLVLMNNWQTSSWSITPMGGGGALWRATGTSCAIKAGDAGYPPH